MPIVTLTSDFGWQDYYAALLKGAILCQNENIRLVDITHNINNYDIVQAAFIFKNAWRAFPAGTIHLVSVNDYNAGNVSFIALERGGHYFIGPDNGLFSLVFDEIPEQIVRLPFVEESSFPLKEVYAHAIGCLAAGKPLAELGEAQHGYLQRLTFQPVTGPSRIRGAVIHIDKYDNVVVNIHRELFEKIGQGRDFALYFKRHDPILRLSRHYHDAPVGGIICLFNSANLLEIAVNQGKASTLLGLKLEDTVQVDFREV
jgi:S-adenosylmethionine hydrolase